MELKIRSALGDSCREFPRRKVPCIAQTDALCDLSSVAIAVRSGASKHDVIAR